MYTPGDDKQTQALAPQAGGAAPARGWTFRLAAFGLTVMSALAGTGLAFWLRGPHQPPLPDSPPDRKDEKASILPDWKKPDLVLVVTGQMHGYLLPCGCSSPQLGGLERRYNLLQLLKEKGWPYVAVDVGDIPQKHGPPEPPLSLPNHQGQIKYEYSMRALEKMGYSAVSFGEYEAALPLFQVVGWALNHPNPPIVSANLKNATGEYDETIHVAKPGIVQGGKSDVKVGVTAVTGPHVGGREGDPKNPGKIKDPAVKFGPTPKALTDALAIMEKAKTDLSVLLYQGPANNSLKDEPPTEAMAAARAFPQFPVIVCLDASDEPSLEPTVVKNPATKQESVILRVGHKGKYVGLLGVYCTGNKAQPFEFKYKAVVLDPKLETPKGEEKDHPILQLMEEYTRELKKQDYLGKYYGPDRQTRHPVQVAALAQGLNEPEFVGSKECKACHGHAYDIWEKSGHSHAYQTLEVKAKRPENRQYDPECVVCHTVGFNYKSGFIAGAKTPGLKDVGCESCHGPSSEHVRAERGRLKDPELFKKREAWYPILNPWKGPENETAKQKDARIGRIDKFCQQCHDIDNDVTWTHKGFERKWPLVDHTLRGPE